MMPKRYSWSEKVRPDHHNTFQRCWDCGLMKIGRHENGEHWVEWRRDGERIKSDRTPACEPVKQEARAA
jgi:hypothetical protein